jgi:hypothetical protein
MFSCFPQKLLGSSNRFLVLPYGELMVLPLKEELSARAPIWFDQESLDSFSALIDDDPIACFGCHREKNFERQYVLAHEIFHIICQNNPQLRSLFSSIAKSTKTKDILNVGNEKSQSYQIEELFCDYAAAWFFGPMYMQSFADEMSYYSAKGTDTHPSGNIRAEILLISNSYKSHRGYKAVNLYVKLKEIKNLNSKQKLVLKEWGTLFSNALKSLGIKKYKFNDISNVIKKSFEANIPFVTEDVRDLINSLPQNRFDLKKTKNYPEIVSESLRKTNLLRQAKKYVRNPERLFSVPQALTKTSSKEKERYK